VDPFRGASLRRIDTTVVVTVGEGVTVVYLRVLTRCVDELLAGKREMKQGNYRKEKGRFVWIKLALVHWFLWGRIK
jgi:hypothetical protein